MSEFTIDSSSYDTALANKIVVLTGGSSGLGLATTELLLSVGAHVVSGDLQPNPLAPHDRLVHVAVDVTDWSAQRELFETAIQQHGHIDHVFANAGVADRADYLVDNFDTNGQLQEPTSLTLDVNLKGMINTAYLALHHFRKQHKRDGNSVDHSIVLTASASSFQRFRVPDYTASKHGILGWQRGILPRIADANKQAPGSHPNVRINSIGPSFTITKIMVPAMSEAVKEHGQKPDVVARNVAMLLADEERQGQFIYSVAGRYFEVEKSLLLPTAEDWVDSKTPRLEAVLDEIAASMAESMKA